MPQSSKSLQGKRVLIVEDDPNSARLFTDLLHTKGTIITHVNNGIDAIRHINLDICDLVILDLRLPGENGFVVTEQIKQKPDLPPAVIVVSAFADKQNRMRAFQAGADAFFSKPVNLKEFRLLPAISLATVIVSAAMQLFSTSTLSKKKLYIDQGMVQKLRRSASLLQGFTT